MSRKRVAICFSSVPYIRGGAEHCVESLCRQMRERDYEVEIVSIPFQWDPKPELVKNMVMWRLLNLDRIAGKGIDLVITTKFPSYMIKHPNKVTWMFHQHRAVYDLYGTPFSDFNAANPEDVRIREQIIDADNRTIPESKSVFTIARNVSNRLQHHNGIKSQPLYHPPMHCGKYYCGGFGDYILSVGRLETLKRVDLLLKAMKHVDKNVKCVIAGTGGMEHYLKSLAKELGIEDRVRFLGFVGDEDLLKLYAGCFSVYFAPYDEDYGYITLEAFLSGKPLVTCTDSGGVMEFAKHNINSKVAERPEPGLIADHINSLYYDPGLCKKLGANGYNQVKDINWENVIKRLTATI